ncbi:uncharacterized protein LOC129593739 [Paramacrobiotus metropolitanus]|uniref:uncharacterized protein LOC129593739 n=1 Tax=Paramacrobiotus metropolitanus TaxID=2943436 RepID=UPI002445AA44|nr:uncharacterized protein LOC129593739 [Paramacrobiotus metropolitanus]
MFCYRSKAEFTDCKVSDHRPQETGGEAVSICFLKVRIMSAEDAPPFPLELTNYATQERQWPTTGNHILAQYDDTSIVVYQAFKPSIAKQIVHHQCYHHSQCIAAGVSMQRMTWIKPNFLWMMFRSGWASKPNQERILAIRLSRQGFEEILSAAVMSRDLEGKGQGKDDLVRLQWDPDHYPDGTKVGCYSDGRRAIQLGIRGEMFARMSEKFIVRVDDVTEFVVAMRERVGKEDLLVPVETVYCVESEELAKKICITS